MTTETKISEEELEISNIRTSIITKTRLLRQKAEIERKLALFDAEIVE